MVREGEGEIGEYQVHPIMLEGQEPNPVPIRRIPTIKVFPTCVLYLFAVMIFMCGFIGAYYTSIWHQVDCHAYLIGVRNHTNPSYYVYDMFVTDYYAISRVESTVHPDAIKHCWTPYSHNELIIEPRSSGEYSTLFMYLSMLSPIYCIFLVWILFRVMVLIKGLCTANTIHSISGDVDPIPFPSVRIDQTYIMGKLNRVELVGRIYGVDVIITDAVFARDRRVFKFGDRIVAY